MEKKAKPVQARSQKTRDNILKAALAMYEKKGYHKTTVDDIAAEAGVSTGIADTDDTGFLEAVTDIRRYLEALLKAFELFHLKYRDIHEELEGLRHTDADVRKLYSEITEEKMKNTTAKLAGLLHDDKNIRERAYAAIGIMEQHCHMMMNNELYGLNADIMLELTVNAALTALSQNRSKQAT